jgi:hypothetical protein
MVDVCGVLVSLEKQAKKADNMAVMLSQGHLWQCV